MNTKQQIGQVGYGIPPICDACGKKLSEWDVYDEEEVIGMIITWVCDRCTCFKAKWSLIDQNGQVVAIYSEDENFEGSAPWSFMEAGSAQP